MPEPTAQERGHLYHKEQPLSYNKGQTGKGVTIGGKVTAKTGSPLQMGDTSAKKLRKEWRAAEKAHGKFPPF